MLFHLLAFSMLSLLTQTRHHYHRFQYDRRNLECHCVAQHLCPDDDIAVNGHGLLDPRIGNKICPKIDDVCCAFPEEQPDNPDTSKADLADDIKKMLPKCGLSNPKNFQSRITAPSTSTHFGELPWNLIVQEYVGDSHRHLYKCGAALIHPRAAISAAHCVAAFVEQAEKIIVRAGEWDTNSRAEPLPYQDSAAEEILVYSNYNPLSLKHDIAIIILTEAFVLADNVGLICLTTFEAVDTANCIASGWGKDAHQHGKYSSVLKKILMPLVEREECVKMLRSTRLGPSYNLHESFICAGGEKNRDACKGDGGSPLICPVDGQRYAQIGVVAWGIGCGNEGIPGVYVNVGLYLDWIDAELSERDFDTSLYRI